MRAPEQPTGCPSAIGAPVHVDPLRVEVEQPQARDGLRGEGLVDFGQLDVCGTDAGAPERPLGRGHGPDPHALRLHSGDRARADARPSGRVPGCVPVPPPSPDSAAAPSLMPDELPAVTVPFFAKTGPSRASDSGVTPARGCSSVSTTTGPPFRLGTSTGTSFVAETAVPRDGTLGARLALGREGVLLLSRYPEFRRPPPRRSARARWSIRR